MTGVGTSLESYQPQPREMSWPGRAWYGAQSARIFLTDILPILARHWTRQRIRDAVRRLQFLTTTEQEAIERRLRTRGL